MEKGRNREIQHGTPQLRYLSGDVLVMASGLAQTIYRWSKELKTGMPTAMPISHDLLSPACSTYTGCSAPPCKALLASGMSICSSHCHEPGNTDKAHPHGAICSSEPYLDRQIFIAIDIYRDRDIKSSAFLKVLTAPFCHCLQTTTSALGESPTHSGSAHFKSP